MLSQFHFIYLKAYIQNLVKNDTVVSEKNKFKFLYVNDLGPRARNDIDLKYSLTFIYWIRCLYIPIFMTLAAIVSEISTVFPFLIEKPKLQNLTLPENRSRSLQGHHFKNI